MYINLDEQNTFFHFLLERTFNIRFFSKRLRSTSSSILLDFFDILGALYFSFKCGGLDMTDEFNIS